MAPRYGVAYERGIGASVSRSLKGWNTSLEGLKGLPRKAKFDNFKEGVWPEFLELYEAVYRTIIDSQKEVERSSESEILAEHTTLRDIAKKDIQPLLNFAADFTGVEYVCKLLDFVAKIFPTEALGDPATIAERVVKVFMPKLAAIPNKPLVGGDRATAFSKFMDELNASGLPGMRTAIMGEAATADSRMRVALSKLAELRTKDKYEYTPVYYKILLEMKLMQQLSALADPDIKVFTEFYDRVEKLQEQIDRDVGQVAVDMSRKGGFPEPLDEILKDLRR